MRILFMGTPDIAAESLAALLGAGHEVCAVFTRRDKPVAGIVGISGRLLVPELLAAEARVKPPVLLIHGDEDPVVPFADLGLAADALAAAGFEVFTYVMKGTGHGISQDGLGATLQFLRDRLKA